MSVALWGAISTLKARMYSLSIARWCEGSEVISTSVVVCAARKGISRKRNSKRFMAGNCSTDRLIHSGIQCAAAKTIAFIGCGQNLQNAYDWGSDRMAHRAHIQSDPILPPVRRLNQKSRLLRDSIR